MQAQHLDNATVLAIMALSTFVMERTVTALLFLCRRFTGFPSDPDREGDYLLWYYALSTLLVTGILLSAKGLRLLYSVGYTQVPEAVDIFVTAILIVAGGQALAEALKLSGAKTSVVAAPPNPPPLKVTGTLKLDAQSPAVKVE